MAGVYNADGSLRIGGNVSRNPISGFTQSVVSIPAAVSTKIASKGDTVYSFQVIGTGHINFSFNTAAIADSGLSLNAATAVGRQGGSYTFETPVVLTSDVFGYSTAGTTVVVLKGDFNG